MSFGHSIFTDATDDLVPRGEGAAPLLRELGKVTPKPTAPEAGRPSYPAVSGDPAVDLVVRRGPQKAVPLRAAIGDQPAEVETTRVSPGGDLSLGEAAESCLRLHAPARADRKGETSRSVSTLDQVHACQTMIAVATVSIVANHTYAG